MSRLESSLAHDLRTELGRLADVLDRRADAAGTQDEVYIEAEPAARHATVLLVRAASAGLLGDLDAVADRAARCAKDGMMPDSASNFAGVLALTGHAAETGGDHEPDDIRTPIVLSNRALTRLAAVSPQDDLLLVWRLLVVPHVRSARPSDFRPDAGSYDFPRETDESRAIRDRGRTDGAIDWRRHALSRVAHERLGTLGSYTRESALTHARAHARAWAEVMRAAVHLIGDPVPTLPRPAFEASPDYSWVKWPSGRTFAFTPAMKVVVRRLCEDYRRGRPGTSKNDILDATDRSRATAVRDIFKRRGGKLDEAWGTMIVPIPGSRDVFTVRDPGVPGAKKSQRRSERAALGGVTLQR